MDNFFARHSHAYKAFLWRWGRHITRYNLMSRPDLLDHTVQKIKNIERLAQQHGAKFLVVIAPSVSQVESGITEFVARTQRVNRGLISRLEKEDIPYVDPLKTMQQEHLVRGKNLFIPMDRHWTKEGHRVVAQALEGPVSKILARAKK